MRFATLLLAALLAAPVFAVVPMPVAEVHDVPRRVVEAFVYAHNPIMFQTSQRSVDLHCRTPWPVHLERLAFATRRDYEEAIRNDGCLVRVVGFEVQRGHDSFFVVESIRTFTK